VDERQLAVALGGREEQGIGHEMVPAEAEDRRPGVDDAADVVDDVGHHLLGHPGAVADVEVVDDLVAVEDAVVPRPEALGKLGAERRLLTDRPAGPNRAPGRFVTALS
jgi:hypothetical protein